MTNAFELSYVYDLDSHVDFPKFGVMRYGEHRGTVQRCALGDWVARWPNGRYSENFFKTRQGATDDLLAG